MSSGDQAPTDGQETNNASTSPAPAASEAAEPQAMNASGESHSETVEGVATSAPPAAPPETKPANPPAKRARVAGPLAARGLGVAKPASPSVSTETLEAADKAGAKTSGKGKPGNKKSNPRPRLAGDKPRPKQPQKAPKSKVAIPNPRHALPDDIQAELDAELAATDVEAMLSGPAGMAHRDEPLSEGASVQGQVLKIHDDSVFVALGGPDEGVVAFDQFEQEPAIGDLIEVLVRGISREDGLYALGLPGSAIEASDWEDIDEGSVVEVTVTGSNSGGLECKVGGMKGFIPISQISEYRVEDTTEFVDQKFRCVVTESSQKRGNLVLSRRAILEREREEKRKEQLEQIEVGDELQGTVRTIKDFGAFVDLGGLDGLIHISKLSWDRVKHPSEVLEVGQQVTVKLDSVDKETGKISLSYRDLLENPWDTAEQEFEVGSVHKGSVTRIAAFGCFVRLAAGVEGLVHISELAHHRVSKVGAFVNEGEEVEVKILTFDRDAQKVSLSIKAAQQAPVDPTKQADKEEVDEPPREVAVKASHTGPLKGGNNQDTGGAQFGLRW